MHLFTSSCLAKLVRQQEGHLTLLMRQFHQSNVHFGDSAFCLTG